MFNISIGSLIITNPVWNSESLNVKLICVTQSTHLVYMYMQIYLRAVSFK